MAYDKYIVSFVPGSSGRFIIEILDRLILGTTDPIEVCEKNSAHLNNTFTGMTVEDSNDDDVYDVFTYQVRDNETHSKILRTHVFPNFDVINKRFCDIGIILVHVGDDDVEEVLFNSYLKNKNVAMPEYMLKHMKRVFKTAHRDFFKEYDPPSNCLVIKYPDIFNKGKTHYLGLEQLRDFTETTITDGLVAVYEQYVIGRRRLVETHLPWLIR